MSQLVDGVLWYVAFLLSTTFHEASHAFVAMKLGDRTAYEGGQVTLDPIPHIRREPFGTVIVPIASFLLGGWMVGWASAPYDPHWAMTHPKRAARMSLAGPSANLVLLVLAALVIRAGIVVGVFAAPDTVDSRHVVTALQAGLPTAVAALVNILFSLNVILFLFNLLPIPPLDGSGILPLFMSDDTARRYLGVIRNPSFAWLGIVLAWKVFDLAYSPLHLWVVNLLYLGEASYR